MNCYTSINCTGNQYHSDETKVTDLEIGSNI